MGLPHALDSAMAFLKMAFFRTTTRKLSHALRGGYTSLLYKKLLFFVHPDFLVQFPREQLVNTGNLQTLSSYVDNLQTRHPFEQRTTTRSLILYLKPGEDSTPRRIKVSLLRLAESMREILEDLDAKELPDIPEIGGSTDSSGQSSSRSRFNTTVSPEEVARFLDSLNDRKDLMSWRRQRQEKLQRLIGVVQSILKCDAIELRYSWSAQSNAILFGHLLGLLESFQFKGQMSGLKLVLTADDFIQNVDPVEGHVLLNPSHVPQQWRDTLSGINPALVLDAKRAQRDLMFLTALVEDELLHLVRAIFAESGCKDKVRVELRNGHTCSRRWLMHFLTSWSEGARPQLPITNISKAIHKQISLVSAGTFPPSQPSTDKDNLSWLQELPVSIRVVVEEGHGSKLLEDGDLRVDCRASRAKVESLMRASAVEALRKTAERKKTQMRIDDRKARICDRFNLISIEVGVGVSESEFDFFLSQVENYFSSLSPGAVGLLGSLVGLRLRVGKYLGLADDGTPILPWSLELPKDRQSDQSSQSSKRHF